MQWGVVVSRSQLGWQVAFGPGDVRTLSVLEAEATLIRVLAMISYVSSQAFRGTVCPVLLVALSWTRCLRLCVQHKSVSLAWLHRSVLKPG